MGKKKIISRSVIDLSFKLEVLSAYYSCSESISFISKKFGIPRCNLYRWKYLFENAPESLSLSEELFNKLSDMRKKRLEKESALPDSAENLKAEIARLRQALEYSELRNEALHEVLKIGRDEYGIDLLKKAGAKQ